MLLTACGTAAIVKTEYRLAQGEKVRVELIAPPAATEEGMQILRERLAEQLASSGLLAAPSDGSAKVLEVTVTNYSLRHGAARAMLGIFAGTDNLQSSVKVKDRATGAVLSEFAVESKNASAWGTSKGLLQDHADQIVATLQGIKR